MVIAGGGMAGLSAALWLARYRRRVHVCDAGPARNEPAWAVHGYPGLPDPSPGELRGTLLEQALVAGAQHAADEIVAVRGEADDFTLDTSSGPLHARRIVLAYGLRDYLPDLPGLRELYGTSVFHCPDCDGPSVTGRRVGVLGADRDAARLALYLLVWANDIVLLTRGEPLRLPRGGRTVLADHAIDIVTDPVARAIGAEGRITGLELLDGATLPLDALFFHLGSEPRCDLAGQLGCRTDRAGYIRVDSGQQTSVRGVHAAGDIAGHPHLAVVAAAEGVRAALSIHRSLLPGERKV